MIIFNSKIRKQIAQIILQNVPSPFIAFHNDTLE